MVKMQGQTIEDLSLGVGLLLYMGIDTMHKNVHIETSDGETIKAHSILLAAVSSKFKAVFAEQNFGIYKVVTPQISSSTWNMMLKFLYSGQINVPKDDDVFKQLVSACEGLELTPLLPYLDLQFNKDFEESESEEEFEVLVRVSTPSKTTNGGDFKCDICPNSYGSPQARNAHRGIAHKGHIKLSRPLSAKVKPGVRPSFRNEGDYECDICGHRFMSPQSLAAHKGYHSRKFKCDVCLKTFMSLPTLDAHKKSHDENGGGDEAVLSDKENTEDDDSEVEDPAEGYKCEICGGSYPTLMSLRCHKGHHTRQSDPDGSQSNTIREEPQSPGSNDSRLSESQTEFVCPVCNMVLPTASSLRSHLGYHNRNCAYCPVCRLKCYSKEYFKAHMAKRHKKVNYDLKKIKWQKNSITKGKVAKVRTETNNKALSKDRINKLIAKDNGKGGVGPLCCPVCNEGFSKPGVLHNHLKFNHVRKNWRLIAERRKMNMANLPPHWTDYMDSECKRCNKTLPNPTALALHYKNNHKDPAPFKCSECPGVFATSKGLAQHLYVHAPQWMAFLCDICDFSGYRMDKLQLHYQRNHPGKEVPRVEPKEEDNDSDADGSD